jgi:enoyl-CoA hydratase
LPQRVPYGVAMEMALTAEPLSAEDALRHRLIDRVCAKGEAVDAAMELAERIAKNAPLAVAASKQTLKGQKGLSNEEFWAFQGPLVGKVFTSNDAKEGPAAFAQKRAPEWSGT